MWWVRLRVPYYRYIKYIYIFYYIDFCQCLKKFGSKIVTAELDILWILNEDPFRELVQNESDSEIQTGFRPVCWRKKPPSAAECDEYINPLKGSLTNN